MIISEGEYREAYQLQLAPMSYLVQIKLADIRSSCNHETSSLKWGTLFFHGQYSDLKLWMFYCRFSD